MKTRSQNIRVITLILLFLFLVTSVSQAEVRTGKYLNIDPSNPRIYTGLTQIKSLTIVELKSGRRHLGTVAYTTDAMQTVRSGLFAANWTLEATGVFFERGEFIVLHPLLRRNNSIYFWEAHGIAEDISMITPYVNESDIASINEAFSCDASAPWGFIHNGIDFFPNEDLRPFQAVSSGLVELVELWQNDISFKWQVNVRIKYSDIYSVEYAFEPFSTVEADGNTQLDNILVSAGQIVAQGEIIGNLYTVGTVDSGAHVHFGLYKNGTAICPEPYFTSEARDSILNLIHEDHPAWNMCY